MFNAIGLAGSKRSGEVLNQFFFLSSGMTITAAVLISMRLLAEERQAGTISLLYSSPVRDGEIVLGKFLSGLAFLSILLALTAFMPALIFVNGKVSFGHIASGYLGLLLIGSAALAIGTFGSALSKSHIVPVLTPRRHEVAPSPCWEVSSVHEAPP